MTQALKSTSGQTLSETVMLLPMFLGMLFAIVQACHLGIAVALVNYGASAYASEAVKQNNINAPSAQARFAKLMMAGLKNAKPDRVLKEPGVTPNIFVTVCAELPSYPFVGPFLNKAIRSSSQSACGGKTVLGPISLSPSPYRFIIRGEAMARMNYGTK